MLGLNNMHPREVAGLVIISVSMSLICGAVLWWVL